jgi:hypothetical protein
MSTLSGGPNTAIDGLVLYLDAANSKSYVSGSSTWIDLSRRTNNATLINGPAYDSANGGSIVFDGFDDYVDLGTTLNSVTIGASFTVNMWVLSRVLIDGNVYYGLISNYSGAGGFQLFTGDGGILYAYGSNFLAKTEKVKKEPDLQRGELTSAQYTNS